MRLQAKFLSAFLPALILTGCGVIMIANRIVHRIILEQVARQGWSELKNIEIRTLPGFRQQKERLLLPDLETAADQAGAVYVAALDNHGLVIADTDIVEKDKLYTDPVSRKILKAGSPMFHDLFFNNQRVLDVAWPVYVHPTESSSDDFVISAGKEKAAMRVGILRMGLPLADALATEAKITHQLMMLLFFTGSFVLGVAFFLMQGILQPVRNLAAATESIGLGHYQAEVPILSGDELGDLARRFNHMSHALAQTTVSKDFLDQILETMLDPLIVLGWMGGCAW
jgi:HAMP domain-containing protein